MAKIKRYTDSKLGWRGELGFMCPGCKRKHWINDARTDISKQPNAPIWTFNGDFDKPTIRASVLVEYRHPKGHTSKNPAPLGYNGPYVTDICHSFITDGRIQFLSDCTHELAGQTVELPDITEE